MYYKNYTIDQFISGFDFVSSSFVNIPISVILWDKLNKFSDIANAKDINEINLCEKTLKFIGKSHNFFKRNNKPKVFKIYKC